jgi:hypothetical protein
VKERNVQHDIRLALGLESDLVLFRNNSGVAFQRHGEREDVVRYGVGGNGGADLLGILAPTGRWIALELKNESGRASKEQEQFLALIRRMGGFGAVVRSIDEARSALERARRGDDR